MILFPKVATKIVLEVQKLIDEDIIVVDTNSIIIASTQKERIGTFHEGAQKVLKSKEKLYIHEQLAHSLKGVKLGINMPILFESNVIGVIGVTGNPKEVEPFAGLIRGMTELIIRESYYAAQIDWKTRGLEAFFYEWVNATEIDYDFLEKGTLLGVPMYQTHLCCLLQIESAAVGDPQWSQQELFEYVQRFFYNEPFFMIRWGQGGILLLANVENGYSRTQFQYQLELLQSHLNKMQCSVAVGVGKNAGTELIHQSFIEAKKALKVTEKHGGISFYEDLVIEIILEDISTEARAEFLERTMKSLEDYPDLIETLQVYLKHNQSIKKTASAMHLHINTLHYRLKQVKEVTGIDPKETEGIVLFYIALLFSNALPVETQTICHDQIMIGDKR
ncbi:CdaR family transcriptional regulator [Bacillus alkalicellulosilyticus]|uniref:CdaR family transcriptional regulator n=1 Tax=Alkalihalobacterium alkalicellulosilyticum TaxID=1912214 RepID=UPI0009967957|nr:sugar diacid recognition domain-containing protein [Bacillus alkalicellulosilyticus]